MPPKNKKRKIEEDISEETYAALLSPLGCPGWCEIESEPAYFNVMLRELGVKGVKVQEVLSLDDAMLEQLPQPVHALIFLFEYKGNGLHQVEQECPRHVWFANQVPDFSCASVALLNIVNNVESIHLGQHLQSFKDFTAGMNPMERGHAIDSFELVKTVHNSFAREMDVLNVNVHLKAKHDKAIKQQRNERDRLARARKTAEKAATGDADTKDQAVRRSTRPPAPRKDLATSVAGFDEEAEAGFHFIAYIPIHGHVWKLDGMDCFPVDQGSYEHLSSWTDLAGLIIQQQMEQYVQGELSFSLMAMTHDTYDDAKDRLTERVPRLHDEKYHRAEGEIAAGANHKHSSSDTDIESPQKHDSSLSAVEPGPSEGSGPSQLEEAEIRRLQTIVDEEGAQRNLDARKATLRRHDFRPFFAAWFDALQEADLLDILKEQVKAGV